MASEQSSAREARQLKNAAARGKLSVYFARLPARRLDCFAALAMTQRPRGCGGTLRLRVTSPQRRMPHHDEPCVAARLAEDRDVADRVRRQAELRELRPAGTAAPPRASPPASSPSASCGNGIPRTRTDSPSGRGARSAAASAGSSASAGDRGRRAARERVRTPSRSRRPAATAACTGASGTTAMKLPIARTTGVMTGIARGVAAKRSKLAKRSASVAPSFNRNGAFSVA